MLFTQEEIVLVPATREQAEAAAPLMYDTDPHLFGYFFGGDQQLALRYFAAQWRQERGLFSYRHCTVAVARGSLLGIELGYDAKTQAEVFRDTGRHGAQIRTPEQMAHLRKAMSYMQFLVPPVPADTYYVLHLASAPFARGRGVGARLLAAAFDRARHNGYRASSTSRATMRRCESTSGWAWRCCRRVASYRCKSTASLVTIAWSRTSRCHYVEKMQFMREASRGGG
jgi:GNAT superfamily N-acetyltransferase